MKNNYVIAYALRLLVALRVHIPRLCRFDSGRRYKRNAIKRFSGKVLKISECRAKFELSIKAQYNTLKAFTRLAALHDGGCFFYFEPFRKGGLLVVL